MKSIRRAVRRFWEEYELYDNSLTVSMVKDILHKQGFTIIFFNNENSPETQKIVDLLNLNRMCEEHNGFTYFNNGIKLVFIKNELNEADKLSVLLHEEGHIFLEHFFRNGNLDDTDTQHENEANTFVLMLLLKIKRTKRVRYINTFLSSVSRVLSITVATAIVVLIYIFFLYNEPTVKQEYDSDSFDSSVLSNVTNIGETGDNIKTDDNRTFYWAEQGTVYHIYRDCQHLSNSKNILSGPASKSGKSRCCKTCQLRYLDEHGD